VQHHPALLQEIAMHVLLLLLLQGTAPAIPSEAQQLGVRLARTSGLAAIAPVLIEKDLADLSREDTSLSAAERERLLSMGRNEARAGLEKLMQAIGSGYAQQLSVEDLRVGDAALFSVAGAPAGALACSGEQAAKHKATAAERLRDEGLSKVARRGDP
jgi:hypothetical protein